MAFVVKTPPDMDKLLAWKEKFPEIDPRALDATIRLMITANELESMMESHFNEYDLTPARYSTMLMLYKCPHKKAKPIDIADHIGVTRGNMTGLLDNLERDEMILREDDPDDRRINYVRLSEKGTRHLMKLLPVHFNRIKKMLSTLTKSEIETFVACLEKIRGGIAEVKKETETPKK